MPTLKPGTRGDALRFEASAVEIAHLTAVGAVPGVSVAAVSARNGAGTAKIRISPDGTGIAWLAPGSGTWGAYTIPDVDGSFLIEDGADADKWARIDVAVAYLSAGAETAVLLALPFSNIVDDVDAAEASAGDIEVHAFTIRNASTKALTSIKGWIAAGVTGLEISKDGVNYYAPDSEGHGDVLVWAALAAGASADLYLRRTIAGSSPSDPDVLTQLEFSFQG
jgi:hypothetical protein